MKALYLQDVQHPYKTISLAAALKRDFFLCLLCEVSTLKWDVLKPNLTAFPTACLREDKKCCMCQGATDSFSIMLWPLLTHVDLKYFKTKIGGRQHRHEQMHYCTALPQGVARAFQSVLLDNGEWERTEGWMCSLCRNNHRDWKSENCQLETNLTLLGRQNFRQWIVTQYLFFFSFPLHHCAGIKHNKGYLCLYVTSRTVHTNQDDFAKTGVFWERKHNNARI